MNKRTIKPIEPWISQLIQDNKLWVLRNKYTHRALGVSYSQDGLKWTMNKYGSFPYFRNAKLVREEDKGKTYLKFVGDTKMSDSVYAEHFIPRNHGNVQTQIAEFLWITKAMKMLYFVGDSSTSENSMDTRPQVVYSTN